MSRKIRKPKHFKDFSEIKTDDKDWKDIRDEEIEKKVIEIKPLNKNQEKFLNAIATSMMTIAIGPAGTGRSWLSCGAALRLLYEGKVERIILVRPQVTCDEDSGYLPGDETDKLIPYLYPLLDALEDFVGEKEVARLIKEDKIRLCSLGLMRGSSFKNSIIIGDEMQNATYSQLKMLLTRMGVNTRIILNGDITQRDNPRSGFTEVLKKLKVLRDDIYFISFNNDDIVRSGLVKKIASVL